MARVSAPLFSASASGKFGDICEFRMVGNRVIAGAIKKRKAPFTEAQRTQAIRFKEAAGSWSALTLPEQEQWADKGPLFDLSGYQLYIREYLNQGILAPDQPILPA